MHVVIAIEDPSRADVRELVQLHRDWSLRQTPPEFSFSVDPAAMSEAGITLLGARRPDGTLLGVGGLKELDPAHGEVKTMHCAEAARGQGVGRALLQALLELAQERGYPRVSLETGTTGAFEPARKLYTSAGFRPGPAFGGYANTDHNLCMTLELSSAQHAGGEQQDQGHDGGQQQAGQAT